MDIPGHENFKADAVNSLASAKGGVFLVDTRNKEQIYKSALFLYDLFISKAVQKLNTSLLIVSNFQDSSESLSGDKLREELEREL